MKIGITIGDAAGIGPEVILKALQTPFDLPFQPVIFGSAAVLEREDQRLLRQLPGYKSCQSSFHVISATETLEEGCIGIVEVCPDMRWEDAPTGHYDARCASLQLRAFEQALEAACSGEIAAVVTAPWNKALFRTINKPALGHTDLLASRFPTAKTVMMLAGPQLRVSLVTTHIPLSRVSQAITFEALHDTICTTARDLERLYGISNPKIAVCGLNPHAGEDGVMGSEERDVIEPALEGIREELGGSVRVIGPLPSDTLFAKYRAGKTPFDAVICMYHDQGLIPLKLLHFGHSANITLGLPIIRTSVDHGTAYDIAGQGVADEGSMRYAITLAIEMAVRTLTYTTTAE